MCGSFLKMRSRTTRKGKTHTISKRLLKSFNADFESCKKKMGKDAREKQNKNKESCCAVCNGEDFVFVTANINCNGKCNARIRRNSHYFVDPTAKFHFCQPCYNDLPATTTMQDQNQTVVVKADLKKKKHDEESKEGLVEAESARNGYIKFVDCTTSSLTKKIIVWTSNDAYEFYCPQCCLDRMEVKKLGKDRTLGPPTKGADKLDRSSMTDYIEKLINIRLKQLRKKEADRLGVRVDRVALPEVFIRTILNRQEPLDVQDQMIRATRITVRIDSQENIGTKVNASLCSKELMELMF